MRFKLPNINYLTLLTLVTLLSFLSACRKSVYIVENMETITDQGGGTGTVTWSSDKHYFLNGYVFVNDGQTLTIEAGTVIRACSGQCGMASGLIVARGGTIIAEGQQNIPSSSQWKEMTSMAVFR